MAPSAAGRPHLCVGPRLRGRLLLSLRVVNLEFVVESHHAAGSGVPQSSMRCCVAPRPDLPLLRAFMQAYLLTLSAT